MKKNTAPTETATARYLPGEEIAVLLPLPLAGTYDYRVSEEMTLTAGDFINVPLGARKAIGVVWGKGEGGVPESKLKDVLGRLDCPPLPEVSRGFVDWTARYTLSAPGAVLKMVMSVPEALTPPKPVIAYTLNPKPEPFKPTKARERVLAVLNDGPPRPAAELAREAGTGSGVVNGLVDAGALSPVNLPARAAGPEPDWRLPGPDLSADQDKAARPLQAATKKAAFPSPFWTAFRGREKPKSISRPSPKP